MTTISPQLESSMNDLSTGNFEKVEASIPIGWQKHILRIIFALIIICGGFFGGYLPGENS